MGNPFFEELKGKREHLDSEFRRNKDWGTLLPLVNLWFEALKKWEEEDTFFDSFRENRMTMRVTKVTAQAGNTKPPNVYQLKKPVGGGPYVADRPAGMVPVDSGIQMLNRADIKARFTPGNFAKPGDKYKLGLLELPGTLLSKDRLILKQGYPVKGTGAFGVFVPLPPQEDHALFYTLNDWAKGNEEAALRMREIRNQLTRLKLGQSDDMHSGMAKISTRTDGRLHYRYGYYGVQDVPVEGTTMKKKVYSSAEEIRNRVSMRMHYSSVLAGMSRADGSYNEIVLAYREHKNALFPMFVDWPGHDDPGKDAPETEMTVTDENGKPVGFVLRNDGKVALP
jgi:hypothetical protein